MEGKEAFSDIYCQALISKSLPIVAPQRQQIQIYFFYLGPASIEQKTPGAEREVLYL